MNSTNWFLLEIKKQNDAKSILTAWHLSDPILCALAIRAAVNLPDFSLYLCHSDNKYLSHRKINTENRPGAELTLHFYMSSMIADDFIYKG